MKKLLILPVLILGITLFSNSQSMAQSNFQIEAGLGYATDIDNAGLQVGAIYHITDKWAGEADVFYFFTEKHYTFWSLNVNAHYKYFGQNELSAYALAGLNIATSKVSVGEFSASSTDAGLNLGTGGNYSLGSFGSIYAEIKYVINGGGWLAITAGIKINI